MKWLMAMTLVLCCLMTLGSAQIIHGTKLTADELVQSRWKLFNDQKLLGDILFNPDGTIGLYDNDNERYWALIDGTLSILNKGKDATCNFVVSFRDYYGKWHLSGRFLLPWAKPGWEHYLVQI